MADAKYFDIGGTSYPIIDQTARDASERALAEAELNRQDSIGAYPGRDIATLLASEIGSGTVYDALHARVEAADWSGLRVYDYLDVPLVSASGVTSDQTERFRIAHFDPYYRAADNEKGHHIAFVCDKTVPVSPSYSGVKNDSFLPWNAAATNQGTSSEKHPYLCSQLKKWEAAFEGCLPTALSLHLLTQRVLLEERYSSSGSITDSNGWSWADVGKVWSLSETEVYGQLVWGTKGHSVGFDCQFDIFRGTNRRSAVDRCSWWLRSVMGGSSSYVCTVYTSGTANSYSAADDWVRPRPGFLLG